MSSTGRDPFMTTPLPIPPGIGGSAAERGGVVMATSPLFRGGTTFVATPRAFPPSEPGSRGVNALSSRPPTQNPLLRHVPIRRRRPFRRAAARSLQLPVDRERGVGLVGAEEARLHAAVEMPAEDGAA